MSRYLYVAAAAATLAFVAGPASAQAPQASPPAATQSNFTDAQLRSFAAASMEIDPISRALPSATAEQRTQATAQIRAILQRHNLDSNTYNAIASRAQSDSALAARIASLQTQGSAGGSAGASANSATPPSGSGAGTPARPPAH